MSYGQKSTVDLLKYAEEKHALVVDLRSDTISKPSASMRRAMFEAEVGDDVFGEDPTVKRLEQKAAKLVGKEAAIFVSSGTMGNLISILNHCDIRGCEAYCGEDSHIVCHEQGGAAQIANVTICPLPNKPDGTFDLKKLESKLKSDRSHEPTSKLICVENTIGGRILPQEWINDVANFAKKHNLKLHMDGARLWNASVGSGVPADKIVEKFDSVTFCLSKGLGAPAGSLLCGTKEFIEKARRSRKVLGGGMRQVGILAAAGIIALDEIVPILKDDHRRARKIAESINNMNSTLFSVDLNTTKTNMILVHTNSKFVSAREFISRIQFVNDDDDDVEDDKILVRGLAISNELARFVLYYEVTDGMVDAAIRKITYVIKEFEAKINK